MGSCSISGKNKGDAAVTCLESSVSETGAEGSSSKTPGDIFFVDAAKSLNDSPSSRLPLAARLAKSSAEAPSEEFLRGKSLLEKKKFSEAIEVFQGILDEKPGDAKAQLFLGKAYAGNGEAKNSAEALGRYLVMEPRDVEALKLHAECNLKYLKVLNPDATEEKTRVQKEIFADQAMLLALSAPGEKRQLAELVKQFHQVQDGSPEQTKEFLAAVNELSQQYLQLGSVVLPHSEDTEFVRGELNALAAQSFEILASVADTSPHAEIKKLAPLYNAYRFLALGDLEAAKSGLEKIRKEVPEADTVLKQMEADHLKMLNLSALDAWDVSIQDHDAVWKDQDSSLAGDAFGRLADAAHDDNKTHIDDFYAKLHLERDLVREVRDRIKKGTAPTIHEALVQITRGESENFKELAQQLLDKESANEHTGSYFIPHLIRYASGLDSKTDNLGAPMGDALFRDMEQLEARFGCAQTAFAVVSILKANSTDAAFQGVCDHYLRSLQEGKDLVGVLGDMIKTTGTDDLVQLVIMAGASKIGSLTKLATLTKLQSAGITGYKAMAIAFAAETLAEGSALWAMNNAHDALLHDSSKVLSAEHLAKSYGTNLIMVGGLKIFGAAGEKLSPSLARSLGMVAEGGQLSTAGKVLSFGFGHFMGLGGTVATTQINQAVGFSEAAKGGLQESLARDFFSYVKYGIAQKGFDHAMGEKASGGKRTLHEKIALKQIEVSTEAALKRLGVRPVKRGADGSPIFADAVAQKLYGQWAFESLRRPGFDAGKLASLLQKKQVKEARGYLRGFGLTLKTEGTKVVGLGEMNPKVAELLTLAAQAKEPGRSSKLLQGAKALALSPAMMFLGAGGLGGGFPHFFPDLPLEKAFIRDVLEEVKKDPELIREIYLTAGEGEDAAAEMLAELAKVHPDAFYYMDNLANRGNETVHGLFKNFNPEALNPKLDQDHSKYILAKYGNKAALDSLLSKSSSGDASALQMVGWLAVDGNPKALETLGKIALTNNDALQDLAKAAAFGDERAFPLLAKAFLTQPSRVHATFHQLVHTRKNEAAREFLKNLNVSGLDDRALKTDWLYLMAECDNHGAIAALGLQAKHDGDALHALFSLVNLGSPEALQQVGELAKTDEVAFRELLRWAEKKNEGAQTLLKNFSVASLSETVKNNEVLFRLAKYGNRGALEQLFIRAKGGDEGAVGSIGLLASAENHPKAVRLLATLMPTQPKAFEELEIAAKAGNRHAKAELITMSERDPRAQKALARL